MSSRAWRWPGSQSFVVNYMTCSVFVGSTWHKSTYITNDESQRLRNLPQRSSHHEQKAMCDNFSGGSSSIRTNTTSSSRSLSIQVPDMHHAAIYFFSFVPSSYPLPLPRGRPMQLRLKVFIFVDFHVHMQFVRCPVHPAHMQFSFSCEV
jgi:hypothetical protein